MSYVYYIIFKELFLNAKYKHNKQILLILKSEKMS